MASWKRTFYSAWMAQVLSIIGFGLALPFLPFYIRELGVQGEAELARWAGITTSAAGLSLAIFAPLWGFLADRFGRKAMVVRAMLGGVVVLTLMAFAQSVEQVVALRLLQGALTGTIAASVALVASVTPPHRTGYTLGMMQAGVFVGFSFGPLVGGVLADRFGYRATFLAGAAMVLVGGLLVAFGTHEGFRRADPATDGRNGSGLRDILRNSAYLSAIFVLFSIRFSDSLPTPAFPLIVRKLHLLEETLNSVTGSIIFCTGAAAALAAAVLGRQSDRWGHKRVLMILSGATAVVLIATAFVRNLGQLFVVRALFGLTAGGMIPAANALICRFTTDRNIGKAYGIATSVASFGWFLGPLAGGYLAASRGLRTPFLVAGLCQIVVTGIVLLFVKTNPMPREQAPQ